MKNTFQFAVRVGFAVEAAAGVCVGDTFEGFAAAEADTKSSGGFEE